MAYNERGIAIRISMLYSIVVMQEEAGALAPDPLRDPCPDSAISVLAKKTEARPAPPPPRSAPRAWTPKHRGLYPHQPSPLGSREVQALRSKFLLVRRDTVFGTAAIEPIQEPQPLLGKG